MTARGLIIGAPRSGSGKTSVTIGLLRALRRQGLAVRGAKSGPDYIDPGFHEAATGLPGVNLDSWAMTPALLDALVAQTFEGAEVVIAESAMGLFDGIQAGQGRTGAGSDLAARYGLPALLVLDVSGQSTTAAAVAKGFATYNPDVRIAGVVLNRAGSDRHIRLCSEAIEAIGLPVVGAVPRNPDMALPERHLGLVQASEHGAIEAFIDRLADVMESALDLERIAAMAQRPQLPGPGDLAAMIPPPGQRIALAQDAAFSFVYPHVARHWREAGAEIVPFSPLADEGPAEDCDSCWLPGGYPELHAARLAAAETFQARIVAFSHTRPVHGECGGYMVLGGALEDADGALHPMLGLLGHTTSFARRKMNLGYRQARLLGDCPIGRAGETIRGHEFHYARVIDPGTDDALAEIADGTGTSIGPSGGRRGLVTGTFFHAIARG
ncbi:cobyrinate a,c-diamide synthase [Chelativorans sp. ZYF759]|uniref:cobyrinate a,c-diamide synthase n=1 Tax=Chelativorans sp. ZYF759 TaxID=2692213 RepID=UPI00145DE241|nr:cobyrinate a,c-diamide synthase [Chelativorans sp. ZYF759]NMG38444.1 cobyrinate a,c-diamide synthase [Chelativorans sp. ZYF759]